MGSQFETEAEGSLVVPPIDRDDHRHKDPYDSPQLEVRLYQASATSVGDRQNDDYWTGSCIVF